MSKYLIDDPWLEYLQTSDGSGRIASDDKKRRRILMKRIARFRHSRKTKPFRKF